MAQNINLAAFMGPQVQVVYDSVAAQNPVVITCAGNTFVTLYCGDSIGLAIGSPTSGEIFGAINTQTGAFKNGVEYSNITTSTFTPTGGTTATTLPDFANRHLSLLDFGGDPSGVADSTTALTNALAAAVAQNVHEVWADGKNGVGDTYKISTLTIPSGITLKCPGPVPLPPANNDFRGIPGFIVTNNHGIIVSGGSEVDNCAIIQTKLNAAPPTTVQGWNTLQTGFVGIGVYCQGDPCAAKNDLIVGFANALYSRGPTTTWYNDLQLDGTNCFTAFQAGGGIEHISGMTCAPFATRGVTNSATTFLSLPVSGFVDNGSGELEATLSSSCSTANCPLTGYTASIVQPAGAQSAGGEFTLENVTSAHADLVGTTSAFLTGYGQTGTVTTGSNAVTGLTTHLNQYQPSQVISETGSCFAAGTKIVAVWRAYGTIFLDHSATCGSTSETITTTDASTGIVGVTSATVSNGGTCYTVGDLLTLLGGTPVGSFNAVVQVTFVTLSGSCSDPLSQGTITRVSINDPGQYTSLTGVGGSTTGGTGSGAVIATNDLPQLLVDASMRYDVGFDVEASNDVKAEGVKVLSHSTGLKIASTANGVDIKNCDLHDENALWGNHVGVWITGGAKANTVNCNSFYSGSSLKVDRTTTAASASNTFSGFIGGSAAASGLQNELFEIESATPGDGSSCRRDPSGRLHESRGCRLYLERR